MEKNKILEKLYNVTIALFLEYMKSENRNARSFERLVKRANKYDRDVGKYERNGKLDAKTSARINAFGDVLLNGKASEMSGVNPRYYAELFFEVYNDFNENKDKSLKLDDVDILQMAIDFLLKESEFTVLQKGAKFKALSFWSTIKEYKDIDSEHIDYAKALFDNCYGDPSKMNILENILAVWNESYSSNDKYEYNEITERAQYIENAYISNQPLNPLLLEESVPMTTVKDFDKLLEQNSPKYFRPDHKYKILQSAAEFFRNNIGQGIEFHNIFTQLNEISSNEVKENLKTILLLKVLNKESLTGIKKVADSLLDKPEIFKNNKPEINNKNFKFLLSLVEGEVLLNPNATLDMLKNIKFLDEAEDKIQDAVNKSTILVVTNKMKSKLNNSVESCAIEKVRGDYLYPGYKLEDIENPDKYMDISTSIRHFTIRVKPMSESERSLNQEKKYIITEVGSSNKNKTEELSASDVIKKYNVDTSFSDSKSILGVFGVGKKITKEQLEELSQSSEYNLRAVNKTQSGYFCHVVPKFAEASFDGKKCEDCVVVCKSDENGKPDFSTRAIMNKDEFKRLFNTEKLQDRLSDSTPSITFQQGFNLLQQIKSGYAKLILLPSYAMNDQILRGLSANGISLEDFFKKNKPICDCVIEKAYSFANDYEKDYNGIADFSESLMTLTQMMQKQGVPEKEIKNIINLCDSQNEIGAMLSAGESLSEKNVYGKKFSSGLEKAKQDFLAQTYYCNISKESDLTIIEFTNDSVKVTTSGFNDFCNAKEFTDGSCDNFYDYIIQNNNCAQVYKKGTHEYAEICASLKNTDIVVRRHSTDDIERIVDAIGYLPPTEIGEHISAQNTRFAKKMGSIFSLGVFSSVTSQPPVPPVCKPSNPRHKKSNRS